MMLGFMFRFFEIWFWYSVCDGGWGVVIDFIFGMFVCFIVSLGYVMMFCLLILFVLGLFSKVIRV